MSRRRSLGLVLAVAVSWLVVGLASSPSAVAGDCGTDAGVAGGAVWVSAQCEEPAGPPVASVASGPQLPIEQLQDAACMATVAVQAAVPLVDCLFPDPPGESVDPGQTMNDLMLEAVRRVRPPAVEVIVQPPGGQTLVNLDTIFLAEAEPVTRPVQLLGRQVLLRITPSRFTWVHGDGSRQVTREPGRRYQRGLPMDEYVTHRYLDAGATVHPRVDVGYSAKFSLDGGATWRNVVGVVTIAGPEGSLEVVEARPVLVGTG